MCIRDRFWIEPADWIRLGLESQVSQGCTNFSICHRTIPWKPSQIQFRNTKRPRKEELREGHHSTTIYHLWACTAILQSLEAKWTAWTPGWHCGHTDKKIHAEITFVFRKCLHKHLEVSKFRSGSVVNSEARSSRGRWVMKKIEDNGSNWSRTQKM